MIQPKKEIVICHRGFVYVGDVTRDEENNELVITNAYNVRRFGTTRGLGQLSLEGPQKETVLDPCGTVRVHVLSVINTIDCEADKWNQAKFS